MGVEFYRLIEVFYGPVELLLLSISISSPGIRYGRLRIKFDCAPIIQYGQVIIAPVQIDIATLTVSFNILGLKLKVPHLQANDLPGQAFTCAPHILSEVKAAGLITLDNRFFPLAWVLIGCFEVAILTLLNNKFAISTCGSNS